MKKTILLTILLIVCVNVRVFSCGIFAGHFAVAIVEDGTDERVTQKKNGTFSGTTK